MANVKNLAFLDKKKLKKLNSFVESELNLSVFYNFPVDFLHNMLPFRLKFLDESFVALENKEVKGLITINKVGDKKVKIKRLLLDENSFEIGKILVNYVVQVYSGKGSESFYVVAEKNNNSLITMFKEGCGFKECAEEIVYKKEKQAIDNDDMNFSHIRKMKFSDIKKMKETGDNLISGYRKQIFSKSIKELKKLFVQNKEKYVVTFENGKIIGYFTINLLNTCDYLLDFVIGQGFEGYAVDIIKYAQVKLSKKKNFKNMFFKLKSYYSNYKELSEIFNIEYEHVLENVVLIKDFYIAQKQEFKFERMIFNDITPAF